MVTPLDAKRRLDKVGVKKMVKHLLDGGVDGIFLLGTTGEGPHLSYAIRRELVKETCRLVNGQDARSPSGKGRVPVLVGITETDLEDALAFAKDCKSYGASGVVAAPPYYFKLTQTECLAWFTELADRLPLPLVIYDMPAHTDTTIEPATIAKLAAHPNIVAMKDSSSVIALFNKFRVALEPFADTFSLFMGPDEAMGEAVGASAPARTSGRVRSRRCILPPRRAIPKRCVRSSASPPQAPICSTGSGRDRADS